MVVNYRVRAEEAAETVQQVEALERRAYLVRADISDAAQVTQIARQVIEDAGSIDILINNAGQAADALDALTVADFDEAVAVNLRSLLVTQAFLPSMRLRNWGRLVFVSSVAAQVGGVVGPHYAASKAGLAGLAHAYAAALAREGITANVVAPALIDTEMVHNNPKARPDLIPLGRFGSPLEVARLVVSIVSNGYITGQTINVNGGWYMSS